MLSLQIGRILLTASSAHKSSRITGRGQLRHSASPSLSLALPKTRCTQTEHTPAIPRFERQATLVAIRSLGQFDSTHRRVQMNLGRVPMAAVEASRQAYG